MAYVNEITTTSSQVNIDNSHERWVLKNGSSITTSGNGIDETSAWHENEIVIGGTITANQTGKAAIYSYGAETSVLVTVNGVLNGYHGVQGRGPQFSLENHGSITGTQAGVVLGDLKSSIENFGTIATPGLNAIIVYGDKAEVINHGLVDGAIYAQSADGLKIVLDKGSEANDGIDIANNAGQTSSVINNGLLSASGWALYGREGDDHFVNRGTISGGIALGDGKDVFDNRQGTIDDAVYGDGGNDTFIVDSKFQISDGVGQGLDTIKSTISYSLSGALLANAEIEKLVLLGKGDLNGTGSSIGNTLVGNAGDNILDGRGGTDYLTGGRGNDIFVFKTGYGFAQVMDFGKGADRVDVSGLDGVTNLKDLWANHLIMDGGHLLLVDGADTLDLGTVAKADLTAGDFIF